MSLATNIRLTPHFTAHEARIDRPEATDTIVENARRVADWLETFRALMNEDVPAGAPERRIIVTSWFRTPEQNKAAGGDADSDHLQALAADVEVTGLSAYDVYVRLKAATDRNRLPAFEDRKSVV